MASVYGRYQTGQLQTVSGQAVAGAQVYFLTQPANTTSLTPLADVFSDSTGTATTNPVVTDGYGMVTAYLAPGVYTVVYVSPITGQINLLDQVVPNPTSGGIILAEAPAGNAPTTTYTLSQTPTQIIGIFKNGQMLTPGAGNDYTVSGNTVTLTSPTEAGDIIYAVYIY